jgi:NAD(P)-dependent dehydrogenase (short-subunit alcohol dehydrogenase family)
MTDMTDQTHPLFSLKEKVVVVTGCAGQLGGAYVKALLEHGAKVAGIDVWLDNPRSHVRGIAVPELLQLHADVTDRGSMTEALDSIIERFGHVDGLVNNAALDNPPRAGGAEVGPFEDYPEDAWDQVVEVNLKGTLVPCQIIGGRMASQGGGGSIVNISSVYGILSPDQRIYEYRRATQPFYKPVAYSVTKSGILNLTRYLATYWAERGVRVNTLTLAGVFDNQDAQFLEGYTARVPVGRMARQDEYNGALVFLVSDASSYMTGSNLVVDGGYSCW